MMFLDLAEPRRYNFAVVHNYFDEVVWPELAHRFRKFKRTKCKNTYPGLYDQSDMDGNVVTGPGADGRDNIHMLAGFLDHGLMHVPGRGSTMAELLLEGRYETTDLTRLRWRCVAENAPSPERWII
jgi:glycine/D-amino acid oxidase-like deaminating enzyme